MGQIVLVVLPVFLLIFLGFWCRRRAFPGDGFWTPAERLTYFLLFPALLAVTLAKADFSQIDVLPMAGAIVAALLTMTALSLVLRPLLGIDGPAFTSVFQGVIRMNTYIGLSVAFGVHGSLGLAAAAVAVVAFVPVVNLLSVTMLARYGSAAQPNLLGIATQVARNPLILGCALGALLNVTGIGLPPVVGPMMEILSRAALPLGLLAVGAALDLRAARTTGRLALVASALKLFVLPAIALAMLRLFGVEGVGAFVALLFTALPTATSSYILARQLGGDAPLMANLTTIQTLLSMASLPLVLALVS